MTASLLLRLSLTAPIALLVGCNQSLTKCEDAIKAKLKTPATYKRVEVMEQGDFRFITFDAANAFGTPIREEASCMLAGDEATVTLKSDTDRLVQELLKAK